MRLLPACIYFSSPGMLACQRVLPLHYADRDTCTEYSLPEIPGLRPSAISDPWSAAATRPAGDTEVSGI